MFELSMLPASDGDCLLLTYGDAKRNNVLIDGGRTGDYRHLKALLQAVADRQEDIELLVVTHIDADHIEGVIKLVQDAHLPVAIREIWFNGFDQMGKLQTMGARQGDELSGLLEVRGWKPNERFGGSTVGWDDVANLPSIALDGGLQLRIVSPDRARLLKLHEEWEKWRTKEAAREAERQRKALKARGIQPMGRTPMPAILDISRLCAEAEEVDDEPPNGSSIGFLASWGARTALLTGDAHPDLLVQSLGGLGATSASRLHVDLLKVSHHGSQGNTTRSLVEILDCNRFAISTNGSRHGHPDPQAIARLIEYCPGRKATFYFNFDQERTKPWATQAFPAQYDIDCVFPAGPDLPITIPV